MVVPDKNVRDRVSILFVLNSFANKGIILTNLKLEVQRRARHETARRRKFEWEVNFGSRNSSRSNVRWRV